MSPLQQQKSKLKEETIPKHKELAETFNSFFNSMVDKQTASNK